MLVSPAVGGSPPAGGERPRDIERRDLGPSVASPPHGSARAVRLQDIIPMLKRAPPIVKPQGAPILHPANRL